MAMLDTLKNLVYQKQLFSEQARMVLDEDENFDQLLLEDAEPTSSALPEGTKDPLQNDNSQVQPEGEQPMPIDTATEPSTANDDGDIMDMEIDARTDTVSNVVPSPPANAGDQIDTADSPNGGDIMDSEISNAEDDNSVELKKEPEEEPEKNFMDEVISTNSEEERDDEEDEEDETEENSDDVMDEEISEEEESGESNEEQEESVASKEEQMESSEMSEDEQLESAGIRIIRYKSPDNIFSESIDLSDQYDFSDGSLFDESIDIYEESSDDEDIFNEAISLDGDDSSSSGDGGDLEPPKPDDDGDSAPDSDLAPEGDNPVTSAVKDKVGESNDDSSIEPSEPSSDDDSSLSGTPAANKDELLKKVANITKSQIDLMTTLQSNQ